MNYDPILAEGKTIGQIKAEQEAINRRIEQMRYPGQPQQQPEPQPQQPPKAKIWDEIDMIMGSMTDEEVALMNQNEEFQESYATINMILMREQMRIMKPIVESTEDGRDALEKHLTLIKRLRKSAKDQAQRRQSEFEEYTRNFSHIPWDEYVAMKSKKSQNQ